MKFNILYSPFKSSKLISGAKPSSSTRKFRYWSPADFGDLRRWSEKNIKFSLLDFPRWGCLIRGVFISPTFAYVHIKMKIFPSQSLLTEEYEKVLHLLSGYCISAMGREEVKKIVPLTDLESIESLLVSAGEMYHVTTAGLPFPTTGYTDIARGLSMLRIVNSVLTVDQLEEIREMMQTVDEVYRFFRNRTGIYPALETLLEGETCEPFICKAIDAILDETGQVRTTASAELTSIRKALARSRSEADRVYGAVISKYRKQGWLTEAEESSRGGRRVIAILAEQKRTARGIVHDISATGKTAFLEPEEAVGINQTIATLEQEERLEILRILRQLTADLRPYTTLLHRYRDQLGLFDLHLAKAQLAHAIDGRFPKITNEPGLHLRQARHPLLVIRHRPLRQATIPFDLKLDHDHRILVISGPNAGGKTVCMKTAGLLQMMIQSGLPVSAHEECTFGLFEHLMVDIGDSQSIEYELSTYSSRLKHMKVFIEKSNGRSLFLIDEFGTGTDPNLGGALAEAILDRLNSLGAFGIITTHYLNLKVMADRTPGIFNGSMEFDLQHLKPLYRLVTGKPGSSYTFLVAERSGLPHEIINKARRLVPQKNLLLEKLLTQVQQERELLKSKLATVQSNDLQLKEQIRKYEAFLKTTEQKINSLEQKLKKSDERLKRENEVRFRNFLKEWKKAKDKKEVYDKYYKLFVQKKQKDSPEKLAKQREEKITKMKALLKPGLKVRLENGHTIGTVDKIDNDKAYVIFGQFRTLCDLSSLEIVDG